MVPAVAVLIAVTVWIEGKAEALTNTWAAMTQTAAAKITPTPLSATNLVIQPTLYPTLGKAQRSRIPKNRGWDTPLSRGLQLDDSAFQSDSDCVGSVVRAKFREDVLDVSLNRFLGD